uniref:Uncharacterized protein n=1 Tax=Arundo donax TaxID=35708 RepID=A0A0A8ZID6_ARUDO
MGQSTIYQSFNKDQDQAGRMWYSSTCIHRFVTPLSVHSVF